MDLREKELAREDDFRSAWRRKLHWVIFGTETPAGRLFDIILLCAILLSVGAVMLESVASIRRDWGPWLRAVEWGFTGLFTIEYFLRILSVRHARKYIFSFMGIVDLLAILPTYISLFTAGGQYLMVIRTIRLLRVFRILKLARMIREAEILANALMASRHKIIVFLGSIVTITLIMGTIMYLIEGEENGFTSIPRSIYWAIVTLTTVGYGDIAPKTVLGQTMASIIMILGYSIIAVPTGIVTAEITHQSLVDRQRHREEEARHPGRVPPPNHCATCGDSLPHLDREMAYCPWCGNPLN